MSAFKRKVSLTGPTSFKQLEVRPAAKIAAGSKGVVVAMQHAFKEMGILRSMRSLLRMNQQDGFDCPSCAWPDPAQPSKLGEYCENGAKALADEATTTHIGAEFFSKNSVEALSQLSDYEINKLGRITEPLVLKPGKINYEPISWDAAFALISEQLRQLSHPDEAIFYTSGRSSNEAAFLYGMFARALGTNNLPDCSNMCHESSGVALSQTLGIGKGSVVLEDLHKAEVVIVAGQNPGTNHPRMLSALAKCKENGGHIISINPLEETGLVNFKNPQQLKGWIGTGQPLTDVHLPVKINQDIPLLKLILKELLKLDQAGTKVFDHEFINTYTAGYDALIADLNTYDKTALLEQAGVGEQAIAQTVKLLSKASDIVVCWAMGLTQHKNGVDTIKEYVNLLLAKGAIGKPNAGTCPVRGHSNVQGDRSVGIMHYVNKDLNNRIETHMGFRPPEHEGLDTVGAMKAMHDGKAKVFMALGGNFVMAASDTEYTAAAMEQCELTVQVSTKLNRSHLITGKAALLLPTIGRSEKDIRDGKQRFFTVENSMGQVRRSKGMLRPASDKIMSEPEIIAGIADSYFLGNHAVPWAEMGKDYELIRTYIDRVIKGFEATSKRSAGPGYYLPNNVRELDFSKLPGGRAQFSISPLPAHQLEADELLLMTIRTHDQFNTTIYGLDDRYRGIYGERRVVLMNPDDMLERGLGNQDVVDLTSNYDGQLRKAINFKVVPYKIPKGNLGAYFPETNLLVPYNHYADHSKTPISKSIKVRLVKRRSE